MKSVSINLTRSSALFQFFQTFSTRGTPKTRKCFRGTARTRKCFRGTSTTRKCFQLENVFVEPLELESVFVEPLEQESVFVETLEQESVFVEPLEQERVFVEPLKQESVFVELYSARTLRRTKYVDKLFPLLYCRCFFHNFRTGHFSVEKYLVLQDIVLTSIKILRGARNSKQ
ncbi:UNVERIFIED_CONTAM: hypothetical protein NCL1_02110 [Trichonephila clavipes]